jgi:hypothetical protein
MAVLQKYIRTANSAPNLPYGAVTAGGGAGDSSSPFSTLAQLKTDIDSSSSADSVVYNVHPACALVNAGSNALWDNIGQGSKYSAVTFQPWQDILTNEPLYASQGWKGGFDVLQQIASGSWTQGSISGAVWSAGTGDVYRALINTTEAVRCWGGHATGDMIGDPTMRGVRCGTLDYVTEEGDFGLASAGGSDQYLYVKTGVVGTDPTTRWTYFCYYRPDLYSMYFRSTANVTITDLQMIGTTMQFAPVSHGQKSENITITRFKHRFGSSKGVYFATVRQTVQANADVNAGATSMTLTAGFGGTTNTYVLQFANSEARSATLTNGSTAVSWSGGLATNAKSRYVGYALTDIYSMAQDVLIDEPDGDTMLHETKPDKNVVLERGTNDFVQLYGDGDNFVVRNPKVKGYSHGGVTITASTEANARDYDQYPRNCRIEVTSYADGKSHIIGGPGYQRAFLVLVPVNGVVGPVLVSEQSVQSQIGGQVTVDGPLFDGTCTDGDDPLNNKYNTGTHLNVQAGPFNYTFTNPRVRINGARHDITAAFAFVWLKSASPDGTIELNGCLWRDSGHARFYPGASTSGDAAYTRRKTPLIGESPTDADEGSSQIIRGGFVVLDGGGVAMLQLKKAGGNDQANGTDANYPLVQYNDGVAMGGRISNMQQGTLASFGFDNDLNYIGTRNTPVQTGSRAVRGYR